MKSGKKSVKTQKTGKGKGVSRPAVIPNDKAISPKKTK